MGYDNKGYLLHPTASAPVLSPVQRLDWFFNSIREKNSLVVMGKLEEFDEPYRSEKPF
jgi:hypothetical protein